MMKIACGSLLFVGDAAANAYFSSDYSQGGLFLAALGSVALMAPEVMRWVDGLFRGDALDA
jgi:hypothetical protein